MHLIYGFDALRNKKLKCALTLGKFDGVHQGHQRVIKQLNQVAQENGCVSVLLTFEPYPRDFFQQQKQLRITTLREKCYLFKKLALDYVLCLPFNQKLSEMSANAFLEALLSMGVEHIILGKEQRFGYKGEGNIDFLNSKQGLLGFKVHIVESVMENKVKVSSTEARSMLRNNELSLLSSYLGHDYFMIGRVVRGKGMGDTLGFPTANLQVFHQQGLRGVYLACATILNESSPTYWALVNIGNRPTFEDGKGLTVEAHLLSFKGNLYGAFLKIAFKCKIRSEKKFVSIDQLVEQIKLDKKVAQQKVEQLI